MKSQDSSSHLWRGGWSSVWSGHQGGLGCVDGVWSISGPRMPLTTLLACSPRLRGRQRFLWSQLCFLFWVLSWIFLKLHTSPALGWAILLSLVDLKKKDLNYMLSVYVYSSCKNDAVWKSIKFPFRPLQWHSYPTSHPSSLFSLYLHSNRGFYRKYVV